MLATVTSVLRPILTAVSLPSLISLYVVVLPKPVALAVLAMVSARGSMMFLPRPGMDAVRDLVDKNDHFHYKIFVQSFNNLFSFFVRRLWRLPLAR